MVRNEADIVDLTIRHHLRFGCERRCLSSTTVNRSHGYRSSPPGAGGRLRIRWTNEPGPFRQSEIMTDLAREAHGLGADWILPFDADEFWWCRPEPQLGAFLDAAGNVGAFLAPVVNFVQKRSCHTSSRRGLLGMTMRAIPVPPGEDAMTLVTNREIGFVEMVYPPKAVFQPVPRWSLQWVITRSQTRSDRRSLLTTSRAFMPPFAPDRSSKQR